MPSPVAHTLAGLAIAKLVATGETRRPGVWLALGAVAANAPDLDMVAGAVVGQVNALHGTASHSVVATLAAAALCTVPAARSLGGRKRVGMLVLAAYASHVCLDLFCGPPQRKGLPLFWPFSDADFMAPWLPFPGIIHGPAYGGLAEFFGELLTMHNVRTIAFELAVFAPGMWLIRYATRRGRARRPSPHR
jgi:membrane-bound metal-dependent hydrolase YbcI (DUF457 family)